MRLGIPALGIPSGQSKAAGGGAGGTANGQLVFNVKQKTGFLFFYIRML